MKVTLVWFFSISKKCEYIHFRFFDSENSENRVKIRSNDIYFYVFKEYILKINLTIICFIFTLQLSKLVLIKPLFSFSYFVLKTVIRFISWTLDSMNLNESYPCRHTNLKKKKGERHKEEWIFSICDVKCCFIFKLTVGFPLQSFFSTTFFMLQHFNDILT